MYSDPAAFFPAVSAIDFVYPLNSARWKRAIRDIIGVFLPSCSIMHFPLPKPVPAQIAQVSSPINSPATAPLLSIPAELRNQIYEYLLVDDRPVQVEYGVESPASKVTSFKGSSAIIRTCRQIYHEAIGVLYGHNIFEFTYRFPDDQVPVFIITPVEVCQQWTQDIGSSVSSLRNITIELAVLDVPGDPDNPEEEDFYEIGHTPLEILPLLDIFWSGCASNLSLRFECRPSYNYAADLDLKAIERALHELGKTDSLDLKKTRCLLRGVEVELNGTQGAVCFQSTSEQANVTRPFQLSQETQEYELRPIKPTLPDLPYNVISDIAWLVPTTREVTYNFYTGDTHGYDFSLLDVNHQLRSKCFTDFAFRTHFIIILGSGTLQTTPAMFQGLDRRITQNFEHIWHIRDSINEDGRSLVHCTPISAAQIGNIVPMTIVLQFQTDTLVHLAGVRIDARDLLRATCVFPASSTVIVRVCGRDETKEHVTTLGDVRKYVLILMEDSDKRAEEGDEEPVVEVQLNHDCLPVQVTYTKETSSQLAAQDDEKKVEEVNIAALHKLVALYDVESAKKGHDRTMGHKCYERPRGWNDETRWGLIRCLRPLNG